MIHCMPLLHQPSETATQQNEISVPVNGNDEQSLFLVAAVSHIKS